MPISSMVNSFRFGAPAGGTQLDFSDLGTVIGHWGPESDVTFHSGVIVSQWNDLSGNGAHFVQGTSANAPEQDRTINGFPALNFIAANVDKMTAAGATSVLPGASLAVIITDISATAFIMGTGAPSTGNNGWNHTFLTTPAVRCRVTDGTNEASVNRSGGSVGTPCIIGGRWLTGTVFSRVNDGISSLAPAPGNLGSIGTDALSIGGTTGSSSLPWDGALVELVCFSGDIGATNWQTASDRFKAKYELSF